MSEINENKEDKKTPIYRNAFRDTLETEVSKSAIVNTINTATRQALTRLIEQVEDDGQDDDEDWYEFISSVYARVSNPKSFKEEWLNFQLFENDNSEDEYWLSDVWSIGDEKSDHYANKEDFLKELNIELAINVVESAWMIACSKSLTMQWLAENISYVQSELKWTDFYSNTNDEIASITSLDLNQEEKKAFLDELFTRYTNIPQGESKAAAIAYFNRATRKDEDMEYEEAIDDCKKAIEIYPEYAEAYLLLGMVQNQKDLTEDSIETFAKLLELDPNNIKVYELSAEAKYAQDDHIGALKDFFKLLELDKHKYDIYFRCAEIQIEIKDYQDALKSLSTPIDIIGAASGDIDIFEFHLLKECYELRGICNDQVGDKESAISDFTNAIEAAARLKTHTSFLPPEGDEDSSRFYFNRGKLRKDINDLQGAVQDLEKATELGNEDAAKLLKEHCE